MAVNPKLSVGDLAPDFSLPTDDQGTVSLADFRGQKLVIYFYPKDMTPGCTAQACDFRDRYAALQAAGWTVLGVSPDSVQSHAKFRAKHELNFPLVADVDHAMADAYGVWREKTNYGKVYVGIVRSTFLIDAGGKISAIQDNVKATGHVERLARELV
ncbi:MAG: thioredoxin-dependent thiol peroxidase [Bradymonadaceae bacterium]|nr:thioredoxin-dependent thiol peroxidase [Lujinxingiaceae bacterium]